MNMDINRNYGVYRDSRLTDWTASSMELMMMLLLILSSTMKKMLMMMLLLLMHEIETYSSHNAAPRNLLLLQRSKCIIIFIDCHSRPKPLVQTWPAVQMSALGHDWLIAHSLEADCAYESLVSVHVAIVVDDLRHVC